MFRYEEYSNYGDEILFSATFEGSVHRVRGLIEMGRKILGVSTIPFSSRTFTDVTVLHVAIFRKHPDMLACLLQAKNIDEAIKIRCKEGKSNEYSPLQLAAKIAMDNADAYSRMVCIYLCCIISLVVKYYSSYNPCIYIIAL